jgi:uncharacterized protein (TIGR02569 family)
VVAAFAPGATPKPLAGGQGGSFLAGQVVLKRVALESEAEWSAATLESIPRAGFRVPTPVRAPNGAVVVDGWTAWTFLPGEPAGPNGGRWDETLAACEAFHRALSGIPRPAFLDARTDPWAIADRMAFGETPLRCSAAVREVLSSLLPLLEPVALPSQVIHGDLAGNVLFADREPPGIIDFTPYWRPALFAAAVVAVDAFSWAGVDESHAIRFSDDPAFPQMFARAALRRLLEFDQHLQLGHARAADLPGYARAIEAAIRLLAR